MFDHAKKVQAVKVVGTVTVGILSRQQSIALSLTSGFSITSHFHPPGNIWKDPETPSTVINGIRVILACSLAETNILNILSVLGRTSNRVSQPRMPIMLDRESLL